MVDELRRGFDDPVVWAHDFLQLDLHPTQAKFLRASVGPGIKEANFSAGNRTGKSDMAAVKLGWTAFYQKRNPKFALDAQGRPRDYRSINVSISLDQAMIVFNKFAGYAQNSPKLKYLIDRLVYSPFPELCFRAQKGSTKGAQVWARSTAHGAKYLLGQNFQHLNFDEAALEPNGEAIMNDVIRMRMADSGGNIDTTSQPRGKNWFYRHFEKGNPTSALYDPACYSQIASSFENPHIDHDHIRRSMRYMTENQILENIYGQFGEGGVFFPADRIQACYANQEYELPIARGFDLLWETLGDSVRARPVATRGQPVYVMGVDLAAKQDQTCIVVLRIDTNPWQMVYFDLLGRMDWKLIKHRVSEVHHRYAAWGLVDSTGAGGPIHEDLIGEFNCDLEGYNFGGTGGNKLTLLYELQLAIQNREFVFPYYGETDRMGTRALVEQLTYYALEDKKLRTDAVFGLALAVKAARDAMSREGGINVTAPDLPAVFGRRDRATGLYIFDAADEDDDPYDVAGKSDRQLDRYLGRYRHLIA